MKNNGGLVRSVFVKRNPCRSGEFMVTYKQEIKDMKSVTLPEVATSGSRYGEAATTLRTRLYLSLGRFTMFLCVVRYGESNPEIMIPRDGCRTPHLFLVFDFSPGCSGSGLPPL